MEKQYPDLQNLNQLENYADHLSMWEWVILKTENIQSKKKWGCKALPNEQENHQVMSQYTQQENPTEVANTAIQPV